MVYWSADSGSGGAGPSGIHLHHHGGLPKCVDLPHFCSPPGTSQRCLYQAVEDNNEEIRQTKKFPQHKNKDVIHRNGEYDYVILFIQFAVYAPIELP